MQRTLKVGANQVQRYQLVPIMYSVTPQIPIHSLIKIHWKPPEDNQEYVTHYEVRKKQTS